MKKIFSLIVLLTGVMSFTSCSNDDATYNAIVPLEVTSADVLFEPTGGTGSIVINTLEALSAVSDSPWISVQVNGNKVSLEVSENPSIDSRSAIISLSAGGKVAKVTATQKGFVCGIKGSSELVVKSDAASSLNVELASTYPLSTIDIAVQSNSDWITAVYNEKTERIEIETTANSTGMMRKGTVSVKMDDIEDEISILQFEFEKDVLGTYTFVYQSFDSKWNTGTTRAIQATLTENALLLPVSSSSTLSIPISITKGNPGEFSISVESASYCGRYGSYYIFVQFLDKNLNYWTSTNKGYYSTASLQLETESDGTPVQQATFTGGYISNYGIRAWRFMAATENRFAGTTYFLLGALNPVLIKTSATAAPANAEDLKYILAPN